MVILVVFPSDFDHVPAHVLQQSPAHPKKTPQVPIIHSINPTASMERGETTVTLMGQGFLSIPTLACRFGLANSTQPAQVVSSEHIKCLTPAESEPGEVYLEVTLNGLDYTAQQIPFNFLPMVSISRLAPETGLVSGGTPVTLDGSGFAEVGRKGVRVVCHWELPGLAPREELVTQASVTSNSTLACVSPPAGQPGSARVSVFANNVNVANDADGALLFDYKTRAVVNQLIPAHGKPLGGTQITVIGDDFEDDGDLSCRFHPVSTGKKSAVEIYTGVDVPAEFVSTTEVRCLSPALGSLWPQQGDSSDVGHALVEVSKSMLSSETFDTNRGISFWYRPQPKVSSCVFVFYASALNLF